MFPTSGVRLLAVARKAGVFDRSQRITNFFSIGAALAIFGTPIHVLETIWKEWLQEIGRGVRPVPALLLHL
jgi:hypothetical protein